MSSQVSAQLRLGDSELTSHSKDQVLTKIDAAKKLAGLSRLLYLPSQNKRLNDAVIRHCRDNGIEIYLWYKVLADNDIIAERSELVETAWGKSGTGESGVWAPLFISEETHLFGCPRNPKYNTLLANRCRQALEQYDGLFADCIGFPLPTLGLEAQFSCFCGYCREAEPRLEEWRGNVFDLREALVSASDGDLVRWDTVRNILAEFGLMEFSDFRRRSITELTAKYSTIAREMGKGFGLDIISPILSLMSGHDYRQLGELADWLKPRIYYRVLGPSSIPLEICALTMGIKAWSRGLTIPGILAWLSRSTGMTFPSNIHALRQNRLPDSVIVHEITKAAESTRCPIHPGLEFSIHPEYDTGLNAESIRKCVAEIKGSPGLVMCWNLIHIPDKYLRIVGEENA